MSKFTRFVGFLQDRKPTLIRTVSVIQAGNERKISGAAMSRTFPGLGLPRDLFDVSGDEYGGLCEA